MRTTETDKGRRTFPTVCAAAVCGLCCVAAPALAGDAIENAVAANFKQVVVFGVLGTVGVVAVVFGTVSSVINTKRREQTQRELAAYVAEGSMTPADAEKLLRAGGDED